MGVNLDIMSPLPISLLFISFLQYKHGGPIIAVQVENEYGSYNKDRAYMPYIKKVRVTTLMASHFFLWTLL
jgi:beta-galactosidase GanA